MLSDQEPWKEVDLKKKDATPSKPILILKEKDNKNIDATKLNDIQNCCHSWMRFFVDVLKSQKKKKKKKKKISLKHVSLYFFQ